MNFWKLTDEYMLKSNGNRYRMGDYNISFWPTEAQGFKHTKKYGTHRMGNGCMRAVWYRMKKAEVTNPISPDGLHKAKLGKMIEHYVFEEWKTRNLLVANNIKFFNTRYNISGEVDAIIRDPKNPEKLIIIEMKSIYGYYAVRMVMGYYDRKAGRQVPGVPKDAHLLQTCIYVHFNKDPAVTHGKICYIARDSSERTEFDVEVVDVDGTLHPKVNGKVWKDYNFSSVLEAYDRYNCMAEDPNDVPPRDWELIYDDEDVEKRYEAGLISKTKYDKWQNGKDVPGDFQCSYCNYKDLCYKLKKHRNFKEQSLNS